MHRDLISPHGDKTLVKILNGKPVFSFCQDRGNTDKKNQEKDCKSSLFRELSFQQKSSNLFQ